MSHTFNILSVVVALYDNFDFLFLKLIFLSLWYLLVCVLLSISFILCFNILDFMSTKEKRKNISKILKSKLAIILFYRACSVITSAISWLGYQNHWRLTLKIFLEIILCNHVWCTSIYIKVVSGERIMLYLSILHE